MYNKTSLQCNLHTASYHFSFAFVPQTFRVEHAATVQENGLVPAHDQSSNAEEQYRSFIYTIQIVFLKALSIAHGFL